MIQLAQWHIDPDDRSLTNTESGLVKHLEPKTMGVLLLLIERRGEVVSRDEFMQRVWGGSFTVEESLTRCISELRKAFNETPKASQFIKTIHGTGYQLLVSATTFDTSTKISTSNKTNTHKSKLYAASFAGVLALILITGWMFTAWSPEARLEQNAPDTRDTRASHTISFEQILAKHLLSLEELPSAFWLTGSNSNTQYEIVINRLQNSSDAEETVNIQVKSDKGLPIWQGRRALSTHAERMLVADDLESVLVKAESSKIAPETTSLPKDLQAQYQHALYLMDKRGKDNLQQAIEILEQIVSQRSDFVMGFIQQAGAVRSLSLYETTFDDRRKYLTKHDLLLKQAKVVAPDHPVIEAILYDFSLSESNFKDYEQILKTSVEYAPACVICVRELAELYLHLGYFQKAAQTVENHIDYFPLSVFMHSYLAGIYAHQGNIELVESQAHIVEALGQDRGFDALSINLQVAMMKGDKVSYSSIRENLLKEHPSYFQHLQVHDALLEMDVSKAKAIVSEMPLLDFNIGMSVGMFDELLQRIDQNLRKGSIRDFKFIHGYLLPDSYLFESYSKNLRAFKNKQEVISLFEELGMLAYWQENKEWPDYCRYLEHHKHRPSYCPEKL